MNSAFGVDHGDEFSKARRQKVKRGRVVPLREQFPRAASLPGKVVNTPISLNTIGQAASKVPTTIGNLAAKKPGLTGTAVVGAGGYQAYKVAEGRAARKHNKKKQ